MGDIGCADTQGRGRGTRAQGAGAERRGAGADTQGRISLLRIFSRGFIPRISRALYNLSCRGADYAIVKGKPDAFS